jgi:hypothetical protein
MSTPPNLTEINKVRAQHGKPPLGLPTDIDAEELQKKPIVKEIHHHHYNNASPDLSISRIALARYLFPLCAGTFTGAIVNQVYGIMASMVVCILEVAIVGFVLAYKEEKK